MKRLNNSAISKLGESAYDALVMTNQVNGDEKRILHYSYNLTNEESYGELTRKNPMYRSERMIHSLSSEEKHASAAEKTKLQRSSSNPALSAGRRMSDSEAERGLKRPNAKDRVFNGGTKQDYAGKSSALGVSKATITKNPETLNNGSRETHTRKLGLGETTNTSLMSHKFRKKAVCDSTDNSHYQRQFLRVLNKRF